MAYSSGGEFIESIPQSRPDCVVLDLHMPNVNGFRVQTWLGRSGLTVPVIVITGRDTPETQRLAMERGAVAYFRKPVDGGALLTAIAAATDRARKNGRDKPQTTQ